MRLLMVIAHPLGDSLSHRFADRLSRDLTGRGHDVTLRDLYAEGFAPALTADERRAYYSTPFEDETGLKTFDGMVLVFPTWWFGLPAILKGWIDRTFLPGVAYAHDPEHRTLHPGLPHLKSVLAVTTMGAPAWYDRLVARRPVYRALKYGVFKPCAPKARFRFLALNGAEKVTPARLNRFETRLTGAATHLFPTEP